MPVMDISGFSYTYPGSGYPVLDNICMQVSAGECICITGPSGSGKTTLLMAIQGLLNGHNGDRVNTGKIVKQHKTAMVFQNADSQILCATVEDEVCFGPSNMGLTPVDTANAVTQALESVGLSNFRTRNVEELSAGEKHRLTIASVLSMNPGILLLDEPSSQLDDASKNRLFTILARLKEKRHTIIITDHDLDLYGNLVDRYITLQDGRIEADKGHIDSAAVTPSPERTISDCHRKAIEVENLCLSGPDGSTVFRNISFNVYEGEKIYLYGQNGSGKTTFLSCLVGLLRPQSGSIKIAGIESPKPGKLPGKVGMLFQNPCRQLFEDTVYDEVAFSLKMMGMTPSQIRVAVEDILELLEIGNLEKRSPLTLSFGEQHRVALASVLVTTPQVLLLDEPFSGLDFEQRKRIIGSLTRLSYKRKTTVLIASHRSLPDSKWPDSSFILKEGTIEKF